MVNDTREPRHGIGHGQNDVVAEGVCHFPRQLAPVVLQLLLQPCLELPNGLLLHCFGLHPHHCGLVTGRRLKSLQPLLDRRELALHTGPAALVPAEGLGLAVAAAVPKLRQDLELVLHRAHGLGHGLPCEGGQVQGVPLPLCDEDLAHGGHDPLHAAPQLRKLLATQLVQRALPQGAVQLQEVLHVLTQLRGLAVARGAPLGQLRRHSRDAGLLHHRLHCPHCTPGLLQEGLPPPFEFPHDQGPGVCCVSPAAVGLRQLQLPLRGRRHGGRT
mmetsp:Transcript_103296/g.333186  ORF Transcript_103296/g.333186 Transcript_103296/m.333186 type:complete len:272 (-) Transcript_103296:53-868(-)